MTANFHFSEPAYFLILILIPILLILYVYTKGRLVRNKQINQFIDAHLLPHLLIQENRTKKKWHYLAPYSLIIVLVTLALAGPRWDYREMETFKASTNLIVLLDLSKSMDAEDLKPSRIKRAKQEIEDLLKSAKDINVALIGFAADPHLISPLTEDYQTILHLLPSISTELIHIQGSKLTPAIEMSLNLLKLNRNLVNQNNNILLITDGGYSDPSVISRIKEINENNIQLYVIGVGSNSGSPIPDNTGRFITQNSQTVISKLEEEKLLQLTKKTRGFYTQSHYTEQDTKNILQEIKRRNKDRDKNKTKTRFWEERFYIFLIPAMIVLLFSFRRIKTNSYAIFVLAMLISSICSNSAQAIDLEYFEQLFLNKNQKAKKAFESKELDKATELFTDPYNKGVSLYKQGNYKEAAELFAKSNNEEVSAQRLYNLGNSFVKMQKFNEAIQQYEAALQQNPDYEDAKYNLELVRKHLQEQKQQQQKNDQEQDSENQDSQEQKQQQGQQQGEQKKEDQKPKQRQDEQKENSQKQSDQPEKTEQKQDDSNKPEQGQQKDPQAEELKNQEQGNKNSEEQNEQTDQKQSEKDRNAKKWLERIENNPKDFLKNQFYIESNNNRTKQETEPW